MALRISKQLSSGWPQLTPAWSLAHRCITLWSGVLSAKFGGHRAFLKNLTSGWPWLTPAWPLTQQWVTLWSRVLPTKFGGHTAFLSNLTSGWPWLTVTEFGGRRAFLNKLTSRWPLTCRVATKSWQFPQLAKPYPRAKFQLCRSKHGRTHSETDRQTWQIDLLIGQ